MIFFQSANMVTLEKIVKRIVRALMMWSATMLSARACMAVQQVWREETAPAVSIANLV